MAFQTVFKRYELKYMLTLDQKQKVLAAISPYMKLDKYGRTTICNLYYDTNTYLLIRRSIEKPVYKEKLRIRSYSKAEADSTVFVELKKKYKLFVVSNCQQGYIESFIHAHHLEKCFDDTQSWGDNPVSKGENNQVIMKRNGVTKAVYVGDTAGDEQSARDAGIPFIFCAYGFGQAKSPDAIINSFEELKDILL